MNAPACAYGGDFFPKGTRMLRRCTVKSFLFIFLLLFFSLAHARTLDRVVIGDFSQGIDTKGAPNGWQVKERKGKADFSVVKDRDIHAVHLRSSNTSFSLQKGVKVDLRKYPILTWKWKVTKLPEGGDLRRSETDDQAAQLFLLFPKTKAIVYVWDTTAPEGLIEDAPGPFFMNIKAVVARSGTAETGEWIQETRNVYEDYKKIFGTEPGSVVGVRIQINSQYTGTSSESFFADVALKEE